MLVAAFGISEFEFAMLKDKGRARFNEYFRARFEYMDTEKYIDEFFNIVTDLQNAPDTMFSTKEISIQYAKMYNLSMEILNDRFYYEKNRIASNQRRKLNVSINYAKYKIVNTLKQAKRNQCLEGKVIKEIIIDNKCIRKYSRVSKLSQYRFRKTAQKIYAKKDTVFDNTELIFRKNDNLLLAQGLGEDVFEYNFNENLEKKKKELAKGSIVIPNKEIFEFNEKIITPENK